MDRKLYKIDMDVRRNGRVGLMDLDNVVETVVKSGQCTSNQVGWDPWSYRQGRSHSFGDHCLSRYKQS